MIIFNSVSYTNFLSTGKAGITIPLSDDPVSLIQGKNGAGKSSFMDAIHYALFGKPFRKIRLAQLSNALNKNKMLVELKFTQAGADYRIKRGAGPAIFEIYKDGKLVRIPAKSADYQTILEDKILGFSSKTFGQVVVLGSSSYTPFMKLSTSDRRLVVEDLLDLRIFSAMNDNIKKRMSVKKDDMSRIQHKYNMLDSEIEIRQENNERIVKMNESSVSDKQRAIEKNQKVVEGINDSISEVSAKIDAIKDIQSESGSTVSSHNKRLAKMRGYHMTYSSKIETINREYSFYESNNNCPTCKQDISDDTKDINILNLNDSRHRLEKGVKKAADSIEQLEDELAVLNREISELREAESELRALNVDLAAASGTTDRLSAEISKINSMRSEVVEDLNALKETLVGISEEKGAIFDDQLILSDISSLLKDDGIKANIINKYIPVLNVLISKNLETLEFPCKFVFDKDFSEVIKSRGRDKFSYNSFSEGEKIRIDIALLFAFKELAQMKNSLNTNLLILDEADQGNLDTEGVAGFLKMIRQQEKSNIFIISHLPEVLASKVDKLLSFEKVGNFSKLDAQAG